MVSNDINRQDFTIYNKILDYSSYVKQYVVVCIPNNHRDLRIHFLDELYMLSKNMFYATYNKGNVRMKYLIEMQVNISLMDMMMNEIRLFSKVPKNNIDSAIKKLSNIKNIIYAWKFNEESKKK